MSLDISSGTQDQFFYIRKNRMWFLTLWYILIAKQRQDFSFKDSVIYFV